MVKMPQRQRHNTGGGTGGADLPLLDPGVIEAHNAVTTSRCCVPLAGGCLKGYELINPDAPSGCVRVICNNEHCRMGMLMHKECFQAWEQHLLNFLRSCGRARSWSEKQRLQNLWTKRGYDLAYRACGCLCGRGHLRKDLNWSPPEDSDEEIRSRRKKKNRNNSKPPLVTIGPVNNTTVTGGQPCQRHRTNSMSSTGSSPPLDSPPSPFHQVNTTNKKKEKNRHGSGGSIFARRLDFSVFNALPKRKINSYHIKMDDDGFHGNDETRSFILSTLAVQRTSQISCVLCHQSLIVFDRYPLIDGTFFLTPVQHTKNVIPVEVDGRRQYLSAVCMGCLEGWNVVLKCMHCCTPWDGSSLILGTMYSFDIFAAMPCCRERLQCSRCESPVISPEQRLPFFSQFSRPVACPSCGFVDHHFVKSVSSSFYRQEHLLSYNITNYNIDSLT
ncbi:UNVERIFIED_CONTAM: hypothetical protein RMT77_005338 [Armadillidium vulgare]